MNNPVNYILDFFRLFDEGKLFLPAGTHAHKIHTKTTPVEVWFSESDSGNLPVCNGNVNYYGVTLVNDGFIFYAKVESDSVEVSWQAVLQTKV